MKPIPVVIDRTSPVPLYHQLAEQLTDAVEGGQLKPGDQFENEMALAERLELSRPTVRRAIAELVDRGLLVRRRGVGTTVAILSQTTEVAQPSNAAVPTELADPAAPKEAPKPVKTAAATPPKSTEPAKVNEPQPVA